MSEQLDRGEAGRSARREYERRRAQREGHARARLGKTLGGLAVRLTDEPAHIAAWKKGADGEVKAAQKLERRLAGTGVVLLHDRRMPRSRANIDHIAIGPGGITVIDPKAYKGKVRTEKRGGIFRPRTEHLLVAGRDCTKLVDGMERQIAAVRTAVGGDVDIQGALCWVNVDGLPTFGRLQPRGILVDGPKQIAKLAARPGDLAPDDVETLAATVAGLFPPA